MKLEISNYWDDFEKRIKETRESIIKNNLPPLRRLTVHLTDACNFRCDYCNMNFENKPKTMDYELVKKIINDFSESESKPSNIIHFTGGEPTIVDYFEDICEYAKSKGLQVSSNTNGYKKINTKNIDKLKCSFDYPQSKSKEFDKAVGIDGAFDRVFCNLKEYSKEMKEKMMSITAVLNKKTYPYMFELAKFVEENFNIYNLYYSNYKGFSDEFSFEKKDIEELFKNHIPRTLDFFEKTSNNYSFKQLALYKERDFIKSKNRFPENKIIPCYIQLSEMTIDTNGNCHNCSHPFRDGVSKSNVNVKNLSLRDCFYKTKEKVKGKKCIYDACLFGCNTNLVGFNKHLEGVLKNNI